MHAGRSHQVTHVVGLEMIAVRKFLRLRVALPLRDDRLRVEVAVFALGLGDDRDDFVHLPVDHRIPSDGIDLRQRLEPFQEIAVVEGRTRKFPRLETGRDAIIGPRVAVFLAAEDRPQVWDHGGAAHIEPLGPKTLRPLHIGEIRHIHLR